MGNVEYLLAGLVILCLNLYHLACQRKLADANTRAFAALSCTGVVVNVLGIAFAMLLHEGDSRQSDALMAVLSLMYASQACVPGVILCYSASLAVESRSRRKKRYVFAVATMLAFLIVVIVNYQTGFVACLDEGGDFSVGPCYLWFVSAMIASYVVVGIDAFRNRSQLTRKRFLVVIEVLLLIVTCIVIQCCFHVYLVLGFGVALGVSVLHLMLNNPSSYIEMQTGVYNARYFRVWCQERLEAGRALHVLSIDLCSLSRANSVYGSKMVDELVGRIARELWNLDKMPRVFRLKPNRFVLCSVSKEEFSCICERVADMLSVPFEIEGCRISVSANVCALQSVRAGSSVKEMEAYLDYLSGKAAAKPGKVRFLWGSQRLSRSYAREVEVERFLDEAIRNNLICVQYQPIYSIAKKRSVSLEALCRLDHPVLGVIGPDLFIPIAERDESILEITKLVFRNTCEFLLANPSLIGCLSNVKVNLTARDLMEPMHCRELVATVEAYGLKPSLFQVEVTETIATQMTSDVLECIAILSNAGIVLCMDDFGSGYANLSALTKLPFRVVKLDRSLLRDICADDRTAVFYKSLLDSIRVMGFDVICEGVEKKSEFQLLKQWGADAIQGYYFSKPLPPEMVAEVVMSPVEGPTETDENSDCRSC